MIDEVVYIDDPLGHRVCLTKEICKPYTKDIDQQDLYDDLQSVVKKPAILIEVSEDAVKLFYFRSIGWNLSALIKTSYENNCWRAYACIINPTHEYVVELLKNGRQII